MTLAPPHFLTYILVMKIPNIPAWQSALIGVVLGALATALITPLLASQEWWPGHSSHDHSSESEYHTHADFLVVINDQLLDLSDPALMSTSKRALAPDVHLHDGDGSIVHYHAPDITFASFLNSIGITLTDTCLTAASQTVCTEKETEVVLFVNEERYEGNPAEYVSADLDRILLYAGERLTGTPREYLDLVEDRACIFSGSCPERGTAPAESCGLTCEM